MVVRHISRAVLALSLFLLSFTITLIPTTPVLAGDADDVLALINQHRANNGLPPLCLNAQLTQAAVNHAQDMATNNYFSHTGLDGSTPMDRIRATGYGGGFFAENIAFGYQSAADVVGGWTGSVAHNAIILDARTTEMGLGRVGDYWSQTFGNAHACSAGSSGNSTGSSTSANPPANSAPSLAPCANAPHDTPTYTVQRGDTLSASRNASASICAA